MLPSILQNPITKEPPAVRWRTLAQHKSRLSCGQKSQAGFSTWGLQSWRGGLLLFACYQPDSCLCWGSI